ncbi:MAG: thermonuclease family protein [Candidatus Saganbacteria bacterium]|nr:thermonuclease family protein [Candidatus Saganbacteria bacterium]
MRKLTFCILISLVFISISGFSKAPSDQYTIKVERVVDGDTIKLVNGEKARYIGIDTPETKHPRKPVQYFGKEASEANRKLVEGKTVRLEFDVQQRDKYGRILAYVYVGDIFVNAWLVENGFAQVSTYPPNVKHQELFLKLQREAREKNRGLWK